MSYYRNALKLSLSKPQFIVLQTVERSWAIFRGCQGHPLVVLRVRVYFPWE